MLTRQRAGVARSQTSTRAGVLAYAQTPDSPQAPVLRPSSRASSVTVLTYGNLRPCSRLSDAGFAAYGEMDQDPDEQGDPLSGMDVIVRNAGLSIDVPVDAIERPASAMERPASAMERPSSAMERPASAMTGMQPYWVLPTTALSVAPPTISVPTSSVAHTRPAGVSRTSGGQYLGLNYHKSYKGPGPQPPGYLPVGANYEEDSDKRQEKTMQLLRRARHTGANSEQETEIANHQQETGSWLDGPQDPVRSPAEQRRVGNTRPVCRLRWTPTVPHYLNNLQRYALTSGCTKFCPGRRFVDFVCRSDAYLLSDKQRQADERFYPKSNKLHFSRTSKAAEPGAFEPYIMQVGYNFFSKDQVPNLNLKLNPNSLVCTRSCPDT